MNGQHNAEQAGQAGQDSHLSFLLNAAGGQNVLMGYPGAAGAGVIAGAPGFARYGMSDASLEEQILQRASALRAEALMQQQQQQHQQRQHQLGAALAALQQQQQLSQLGLNQNHLAALSAQEQEALLGRAAALRELGIPGGAAASLQGAAGGGMERLQQLELGRLEELERRRQQLAALANLSGGTRPGPEAPQSAEVLGQDSAKSEAAAEKERQNANASAEKSKDDLRKTPGTVIVPCRARGMPMDHNFKTAYFVISEDAKHGEDLVCSYFACRNGGVKFRYCAHCMAPVAKRNFCRRHDHGMSAKAGGDVEKDDDEDEASMDRSDRSTAKDEPDEAPSQAKKDKPSGLSAVVPEKEVSKISMRPAVDKDTPRSSLDVLSKAATSSFLMQTEPPKPEPSSAKRKKPTESAIEKVSMGETGGRDDASDEASEDPELASISSKRRKMWSSLLIKRPRTKDPRHLSSWLNEVLTVSDFETPLEQAEASEPKAVKSEPVSAPIEKSKPSKDIEERPAVKKEKKSGEKEKKKRKLDSKASEGPSSKSKKSDTSAKKSEKKAGSSSSASSEPSEKKSPKKSGTKNGKESPLKKESDDGFVGSFADWRDRKKEKALSKKGTGSLRK